MLRSWPWFDADHSDAETVTHCFWSPYYRIDYKPLPARRLYVNLISHQNMVSLQVPSPRYALPHLLNRDTGRQPFEEVLVIGAGSGNDVSRALQWGARYVDAVEIDPVILRLARQQHPDQPYQDSRVTVHLDDGRNFLRTSKRKYDLIVYALVDSLVLHSGLSNIRLESYLFTCEAFTDVRRCLKPGGLFVMYNHFRQGWIVARLHQQLVQTFQTEPLLLTNPYRRMVQPDERLDGFTVLIAGDTERLQIAFSDRPEYWIRNDQAQGPDSPNGFKHLPGAMGQEQWRRFGWSRLGEPNGDLQPATDDWPFLYLRLPMLPELSLGGMAVMAFVSVALLLCFLPDREGRGGQWTEYGRMFLLGAGFMLVETKAVVHMALLFGSTWNVNAVVICAILVMILIANVFILMVRPRRMWPYYSGLFVTLILNCVVPLDMFLGLNPSLQIAGSCLLVFLPIFFAGVVFALFFGQSKEPDRVLGANIAGAMTGGLAESASMVLGFRYLLLIAMAFYALAALLANDQGKRGKAVKTNDVGDRAGTSRAC